MIATDPIQHILLSKEDLERAQKENDDDEKGSDDDGSSSNSDSSDSEASSFGCASEKPSPKKAPKRGGAKAKAKTASAPARRNSRGGGNVKKTGTSEVEKFKAALDGASKFQQLLAELKPDTMWRSCVRTHEVDRRLSRETSVVTTLQFAMEAGEVSQEDKDKGQVLVNDIQYQCHYIRNMKELCRTVRSMKVEELLGEISPSGGATSQLISLISANDFAVSRALALQVGTLADILSFVAKKLVEANASCQTTGV